MFWSTFLPGYFFPFYTSMLSSLIALLKRVSLMMDLWSENVKSQHVYRGKLGAMNWSKGLPTIGLEDMD